MKANILQSTNPWTQEILFEEEAPSPFKIKEICNTLQAQLPTWRNLSWDKRWDILQKGLSYLEEHGEEGALLITREMGKPLWEARTEINAMKAKFKASLESYQNRTQSHNGDLNGISYHLQYKGLGLITVFGPFNLPGHLPHGQILPALLAGNVVLFKPSPLTSAVGAWYARMWSDLPSFQMVQGGIETAQNILSNSHLRGVFFVGSETTGRLLHKQLGGKPEILLSLEMGGNNPLIVGESLDLDSLSHSIIQSFLITSGQRCVCARRLFIPSGKEGDSQLEHLADKLSQCKGGNPEEDVFYGPLVSTQAAQHITHRLQDLKHPSLCHKVWLRGKQDKKHLAFISPSLLEMKKGTSSLDACEDFGPLLKVYRYDSFEQALYEANHTRFGLSAGLISHSSKQWELFLEKVDAGILNWNRPITGASGSLPFGGCKSSGNYRSAGYHTADYCAFPHASLLQEKLNLPTTFSPGLPF